MTDERYERLLAEQKVEWQLLIAIAKKGNPFATLCENCYGRHAPPKDAICPHENIDVTMAKMKKKRKP
jgi:uncharacterized OB-fold protein